jgi:hypothetical protein
MGLQDLLPNQMVPAPIGGEPNIVHQRGDLQPLAACRRQAVYASSEIKEREGVFGYGPRMWLVCGVLLQQ